MEDAIPLLLLLAASGFFSAAEIAFFSVTQGQLLNLSETKEDIHRRARSLLDEPERLLVTILVGNNIVNILLSALATVFAIERYGDSAITYVTPVLTFLVLTFGEIIPKTIASRSPNIIIQVTVHVLSFLNMILRPVSYVFIKFDAVIRRFIPSNDQDESLVTDEIRAIANQALDEGDLTEQDQLIIENVIESKDIDVKSIAKPIQTVVTASEDDSLQQFIEKYDGIYSRIPLTDSKGRVKSYLLVKELLRVKPDFWFNEKLGDYSREIISFKSTDSLERVYDKMIEEKTHIALVMEKRELYGIVTMEDLIEEIFSEIVDETDRERLIEGKLHHY